MTQFWPTKWKQKYIWGGPSRNTIISLVRKKKTAGQYLLYFFLPSSSCLELRSESWEHRCLLWPSPEDGGLGRQRWLVLWGAAPALPCPPFSCEENILLVNSYLPSMFILMFILYSIIWIYHTEIKSLNQSFINRCSSSKFSLYRWKRTQFLRIVLGWGRLGHLLPLVLSETVWGMLPSLRMIKL